MTATEEKMTRDQFQADLDKLVDGFVQSPADATLAISALYLQIEQLQSRAPKRHPRSWATQ